MLKREMSLHGYCVRILNIHYDGETGEFVENTTNYTLEYYDAKTIDIPEIEYEDDIIDSVLFFGDGTIEFHFKNSMDALNWAEFPIEIIDRVINSLAQILQ
jgi:hypothetical protein